MDTTETQTFEDFCKEHEFEADLIFNGVEEHEYEQPYSSFKHVVWQAVFTGVLKSKLGNFAVDHYSVGHGNVINRITLRPQHFNYNNVAFGVARVLELLQKGRQPADRKLAREAVEACVNYTRRGNGGKIIEGPYRPTASDIFMALVSDARCVAGGETFEEFASELGYAIEQNGQTYYAAKAREAYDACVKTNMALLTTLGAHMWEHVLYNLEE